MSKTIYASVLVLAVGGTAAPAAPLTPAPAGAPLILARDGCGLGFHRDFYGACAPNRVFYGAPFRRLPPPCPPFYHRDPDPARPICYPNA